jgi:flagellar motor switch protein FliM
VTTTTTDPTSAAAQGRRGRRRGEPQPFDFRRPSKFSREHTRVLQIVGETWARQYSAVLSSSLRTAAQANLVSIDQLTYDELVGGFANPGYLAILSLDPLPGASLLDLPLDLALSTVDRLLGGTGAGGVPERALTDIETRLVRNLVERGLAELTVAFEPLATKLTPRIVGIESNPQFAQVAAPADMMVALRFEVRLGGDQTWLLGLSLPFSSLHGPIEQYLTHALFADRAGGDPAAIARLVGERLLDAPVEVGVRFHTVTVTSGEILDLEVGDVLGLRHPVGEPLTVLAAGVPCLEAMPGRKDKRLACQVVEARGAGRRP